jgi:hypothetical protein
MTYHIGVSLAFETKITHGQSTQYVIQWVTAILS